MKQDKVNHLVKLITDEDGCKHNSKDWHYIMTIGGSPASFCTGEVFGYGEGAAKYITKAVKKGGITCDECLSMIKEIKGIKL